ncbi:MAG TPA: hypothetical protein VK989_05230 [Polyangia bacterium]|nr:hypothetical protein [Polyangia bacterium]
MEEEQSQRPALPAWPGADEAELTVVCGVMARRLAATSARVIGVVPVGGPVSLNLGPLIVRVASALAGFVGGRVGVVPRWRSWAKDTSGEAGGLRLRAMGPDVVAVVPPAAQNSRAAALAVQEAIWSLPASIKRVVVDLGGYAAPGALPGAGAVADGIVVAVSAGRARRAHVAQLLAAIPTAKSLGTILVG